MCVTERSGETGGGGAYEVCAALSYRRLEPTIPHQLHSTHTELAKNNQYRRINGQQKTNGSLTLISCVTPV